MCSAVAQSMSYSCSINSTCGCSLQSAILTKIIGGETARDDTWGWAVSIRANNIHSCGGSLIAPNLVLTAAHCFASVKDLSKYSITGASSRLSNIRQQRSIAQVFVHRQYHANTFENDLAAVRLSSSFDLDDRSLAVLCSSKGIIKNYTNDITVVAIGWGVFSKDEVISDVLRQVTLKIISYQNAACRRSIRNASIQICAGVPDGNKDTCQGDSGGPLMLFDIDRWHLVGITSYGIGCGLHGYAGVYTRVSAYEDVITYLLDNDTAGIEKVFRTINSASLMCTSFGWIFFMIYLIK